MKERISNKAEIIKAFRHAVDAKASFADMVRGKISKSEFESKGYKLAKLA